MEVVRGTMIKKKLAKEMYVFYVKIPQIKTRKLFSYINRAVRDIIINPTMLPSHIIRDNSEWIHNDHILVQLNNFCIQLTRA